MRLAVRPSWYVKVWQVLRFLVRKVQPRKMRTYMILLTLLSIVLTQGTVYFAFQYYRNRVLNPATAELVADTIRILHGGLDRLPESQQKEYVETATQGKWTVVEHERPYLTPEERALLRAERERNRGWWHRTFKNDQTWQMVRQLNRLLGEKTRVRPLRGAEEALLISLGSEIQEQATGKMQSERWLKIPLDSFQQSGSTLFMFLWWTAVAFSLLLSALFAWYVVRPLEKLSQAADRLAAGDPEVVQPHGPYEIRRLAKRFNAMIASLEEAERTQKTLLAGLPHDLKGPLSRMRLRLALLNDVTVQQGLTTDVEDIQKIIDQFIAYLRGKDLHTYYFSTMLVKDWFEEKMLGWQPISPQIQFALELQQEQLLWDIDTLAISRLLDNLIHNALQYGQPPIQVTCREEADDVVLEVFDHGSGIPVAEQQRAFRPFERLDSARTQTGSSGLGLAVVEAIAQAHGASIECRQHTPHGWSISVRFPKKSE